ncbi:hypothetical protein BYT27DRAFT_7210578 [Phlegmacium glaucopus]|nr:hypothetical protein BYT27DRAFT_7210578 [Phlegmacium glaucopus]
MSFPSPHTFVFEATPAAPSSIESVAPAAIASASPPIAIIALSTPLWQLDPQLHTLSDAIAPVAVPSTISLPPPAVLALTPPITVPSTITPPLEVPYSIHLWTPLLDTFNFDTYATITLSDTSGLPTFVTRNPSHPVQPLHVQNKQQLTGGSEEITNVPAPSNQNKESTTASEQPRMLLCGNKHRTNTQKKTMAQQAAGLIVLKRRHMLGGPTYLQLGYI